MKDIGNTLVFASKPKRNRIWLRKNGSIKQEALSQNAFAVVKIYGTITISAGK